MDSIWQTTSELPKFSQLKNDIKTDVLIIGGGITGILTAYFLHREGVKYLLVDKGRICSKTTGNTTAKITFQHGLIYHKILNSMGLSAAEIYLQANRRAFNEYASMCKKIDCGYCKKDNYVYSVNNMRKLEKEMDALRKIGYAAKLCRDISVPVKTVGAVKFPDQAQFNPLQFISAIAENLNIYENTFVRELSENTAVTDYGKIYAGKIIITTHFPFINNHGCYFLKLYQHRSYVIALENAEDVSGMYVDDDRKGLSFRNYDNLLLLGGGAHRTGKKGGNWDELCNFAKIHYPAAVIKSAWATQDCMSLDDVPYIGQYSPNTPDWYVASGFNKWGMTQSMVAAMILSDMVTGQQNDWAWVYNPGRNILKPRLFVNGFEAVKNILTISKKRCPHLGCALKWNSAEHSWDCACHGSRFDEYGKVLDNPANGDLNN